MATPIFETPKIDQKADVGNCAVDACNQAAHLADDLRRLKSLATDAVEDGVHAAKRAIKSAQRRVEELGDIKDEALHRVKRQPLQAVGAAFGIGVVFGVAVGWIARQARQHE